MKIADGIDMGLIELHQSALWLVNEFLKEQGQPFILDEIDQDCFTMKIRANLNQTQFERLVFKPINEYVHGYTVTADYKTKQMVLTRVNKVVKSKPSATGKQAST